MGGHQPGDGAGPAPAPGFCGAWAAGVGWGAGLAAAVAAFLFATARYGQARREPAVPRVRVLVLGAWLAAAVIALLNTGPPQGWYPGLPWGDNLGSGWRLAAVAYGTASAFLFAVMCVVGWLWTARDAWAARGSR